MKLIWKTLVSFICIGYYILCPLLLGQHWLSFCFTSFDLFLSKFSAFLHLLFCLSLSIPLFLCLSVSLFLFPVHLRPSLNNKSMRELKRKTQIRVGTVYNQIECDATDRGTFCFSMQFHLMIRHTAAEFSIFQTQDANTTWSN